MTSDLFLYILISVTQIVFLIVCIGDIIKSKKIKDEVMHHNIKFCYVFAFIAIVMLILKIYLLNYFILEELGRVLFEITGNKSAFSPIDYGNTFLSVGIEAIILIFCMADLCWIIVYNILTTRKNNKPSKHLRASLLILGLILLILSIVLVMILTNALTTEYKFEPTYVEDSEIEFNIMDQTAFIM